MFPNKQKGIVDVSKWVNKLQNAITLIIGLYTLNHKYKALDN